MKKITTYKKFRSDINLQNCFPINESIIISTSLSLLAGIAIVAPWLTNIYLEWKRDLSEERALKKLEEKDKETKERIESFINRMNPLIQNFEREFRNFSGNNHEKKELVRTFREEIFSHLRQEDKLTQIGVLDILSEIEPKLKDHFRIENWM
jgi:molecular chaperone GrpE (heat shock protein)